MVEGGNYSVLLAKVVGALIREAALIGANTSKRQKMQVSELVGQVYPNAPCIKLPRCPLCIFSYKACLTVGRI